MREYETEQDGYDADDNYVLDALDTIPEDYPTEQQMNEDSDLLNILLSKDEVLNSNVVPDLIKSLVIFYNKTLALSNIQRKDIPMIIQGYDDLKVSALMSRPKKEFTWTEEIYWTAVRQWLKIESTRGVDGFERSMQATQIQQIQSDQKQTMSRGGSTGLMGFLSKTMGKE